MLEKIIDFSIRNKLIVILFTATIAGFGIFSIIKIPVGAVPDITNNQVQVITTTGNLSTQEVEQFLTAPVELEMANLPGVIEIRSISKFGLSVVTIVFEESMGAYLPRQLIAEKIKSASANIPEEFGTPEMGPITTGLGEVYQYILDLRPGYEDKYNAMDLRTIQDWIVRRQLSGIPGVVEINSWGGYLKQYEVAVDPQRMKSLNVTFIEVFEAIESNNSISGGAYIEKTNQAYFIRGDGQVKTLHDIDSIVIRKDAGVTILIKDVADVRFGYANRYGAITANGQGEKVLGQIMMLKDANSKEVMSGVHERILEVQKSLPEGVFINPIVDRTDLIDKTSFTVVENLLLGCLIVFVVVLLILGNLRSALVIASMIPLSLFFTLSVMYVFGIDANLMSLGALDFGIIIDGAVIIVEFIALKITVNKIEINKLNGIEKQGLFDKITLAGASKMMESAIFGQIIILIVFIPILSLSGVEGKMFKPMAMTFSFAIIGAMILGLTWLPVASSLFIKPEKKKKRKNISDWIMNLVHKTYLPVIKWSCCHKKAVLGLALFSLLATGIIFINMGGEFVPTLDEGDFVIQPVLKTGTSLTKTVEMTTEMEKILIDKFPEVEMIVSRIGAAEVPTDPMSMEEIDMIIKLKPKNEWVTANSKEELANLFKEELSVIPGVDYEFTQPIEMRFNELITGVRADIAIKIFGDDLNYLNKKALEIKNLIQDIPGAADIILEKTEGLPQMTVKYDRSKIAFYDVDIKTLNEYLAMAFGGQLAGNVFEVEKRFDLVIRLQEESRTDIENIEYLQIPLKNGNQIPLKELATISYTEGPAKISRDGARRRVVVSVNVRNRDLKSVVEDIQAKIGTNVKLEPGYFIDYGGQFENLENATNRLLIAVPIALLLIFIFLHFAFKSFKDAALIFSAVPLATVGGVLLLWLRGMPFSVSAGIGFIALFGIAVLNGIVLIEHLKELNKKGNMRLRDLIIQGSVDRLRPVLLTAAAAAMGFLPMAISNGAGAEVQRPLATVVIGGLITSTMLTMIALPLLFEIFNNPDGVKNRLLRFLKSKSISIIIIFSFISISSLAQTNELNLNQILTFAVENNKELKAYELGVSKIKTQRKSEFNIDKTSLYYEYDQNNIAANGFPLNIFGVEQSFIFPSVYFKQSNLNNIEINIAQIEYNQKKQVLIKEISKVYYELQFLFHKKESFAVIDSLVSKFNDKAEYRFEIGETGRLDMLNAQAKQQQFKSMLSSLDFDVVNALQKLKSLMNYDKTLNVLNEESTILIPDEFNVNSSMQSEIYKLNAEYQNAILQLERNKLLPDITIGYFNGTNKYEGTEHYHGFQVGIAVPVFYGGQKSKIAAQKISIDIAENYKIQNLNYLNSQYQEYSNELKKYQMMIENYNAQGKILSDEIIRTATKSYSEGEIGFFEFIMSFENSVNIESDFLENVYNYNRIVLEMNYLTK